MRRQLLFATRQSPDWAGLTRDYQRGAPIDPARFRPDQNIPGFPVNLVQLIEGWNRQFPIDFFSCRDQLRIISQATIDLMRDASVISYDDLVSRGPPHLEGGVCFFHDDDDWFAPNISEVVDGLPSNDFDVCVFPLVRLWTDTFTFARDGQPVRLTVGQARDFTFRYQSNNYGIRDSRWDQETLLGMKDHILASTYASDRGFKDLYVDRIVSVTVKTPCSASMLSELMSEPSNARRHLQNYVRALSEVDVPSELDWMGDRIASVAELFSKVAG